MTEAEIQLRKQLDNAFLNGGDDADSVIRLLNDGNYFIYNSEIREIVSSPDFIDYADGAIYYGVWVERVED
jgi:hypothetical protein